MNGIRKIQSETGIPSTFSAREQITKQKKTQICSISADKTARIWTLLDGKPKSWDFSCPSQEKKYNFKACRFIESAGEEEGSNVLLLHTGQGGPSWLTKLRISNESGVDSETKTCWKNVSTAMATTSCGSGGNRAEPGAKGRKKGDEPPPSSPASIVLGSNEGAACFADSSSLRVWCDKLPPHTFAISTMDCAPLSGSENLLALISGSVDYSIAICTQVDKKRSSSSNHHPIIYFALALLILFVAIFFASSRFIN